MRAACPPLTSLETFVAAPQRAQFTDARATSVFEGDPLLLWRLRRGLRDVVWEHTPVTTSDDGLRYDHALGTKPEGAFRVLCVGDSVTFGFGVPEVFLRRPDERHPDWLPYPARMERALRAANPGRTIEVAPMAVPGYSSHQGLAWVRRDLLRFHPDVVTLLFGWNDIGLRGAPDAVTHPVDGVSVASRRLIASSQALLHAWALVHARGSHTAAPLVPRVDVDAFVANHEAMVDAARAAGAAVLVIAPVYRDPVEYASESPLVAARRDALRAAMAARGVPFLDVPELTESAWPGNRPLFLEHIHPNHKGHRLLAERVLASLAAHHLLRDLAVPPAPEPEPEPEP